MQIKLFGTIILLSGSLFMLPAQEAKDPDVFRSVFNEALTSYEAYHNLEWLCKNTKGRIGGRPQAAAAVEFTRQVMEKIGLDSVWLQSVMVKSWDRGEPEKARIISSRFGTMEVPSCALGWSVGTGPDGLSGSVVEVKSAADWKNITRPEVQGRIVFFNQPMNATHLGTFSAYGEAVWQRTNGPAEAARLGAAAVVVRSMTIEIDDFPHTGVTRAAEGVRSVPAIAISTRAAETLSQWLKGDPSLNFYFRTTCEEGPEVPSFNVIGEIRGSEYPNEYITVGGHLDAWDIAEGAHDDGGGCIQSIEMLRLFRTCGIRPRHSIRAVMFMDEEVAQRGGLAYAREASEKGEKHIAALESDRGVFFPQFLGIIGNEAQMERAAEWQPLFDPYRIRLNRGGGGADIGPLKTFYPDILFMGIIPDDSRYFRYHHAASDTFEMVDRREMQMGAAGIACLVYLVDKYGL
ncbi:MAG: peptidase M28 [Bacteroidetes bacterium GWF2_49_14]|nr:MAG: peptidase M28 [Bacteroidetes bacterium GWF2_49_14]HBB93667.1 peptidase M28 family protein [Bacteroidales bacterium]